MNLVNSKRKIWSFICKLMMSSAQLSSLKANMNHKLNTVIHMQGKIRSDLMEMGVELNFLSDSMTVMITSSMGQILKKFKERSELRRVGDVPIQKEVSLSYYLGHFIWFIFHFLTIHVCSFVGKKNGEETADKKGKGKMYPNVQFFDPMTMEPPSFDL